LLGSQSGIPIFFCKGYGKPEETSVSLHIGQAEIQTRDFANTEKNVDLSIFDISIYQKFLNKKRRRLQNCSVML